MTLEEVCKVFDIQDIGEFSDGYHTFNSLYDQRCILFAALVNTFKTKSWKSYKHENGELCFGGGWFIVGIDTPEGSYTYHYENKYWDLFQCKELKTSKHWDGHTEEDVTRLLSLTTSNKTNWIYDEKGECWRCSCCGNKNLNINGNKYTNPFLSIGSQYCPYCGSKMSPNNSKNSENSELQVDDVNEVSNQILQSPLLDEFHPVVIG